MEIGVRELRRRLSEILERAARGQIVRVTDRGVPKAVIGPVPDRARLDRGVAEGWVAPPADRVAPARVRPARSELRIADVLAEDRGA